MLSQPSLVLLSSQTRYPCMSGKCHIPMMAENDVPKVLPIKGTVRNPFQLSCRDFLLSNVQIEKEHKNWSQVQFNETEIAAECLKNSTQLCEDTAIDGTNIAVHNCWYGKLT
ncbi:hypothetical protein VNO80_29741 [Phaseolus coccineus]|uniref:Uncharacterized protein n=1 Tax=Phaseolus coccineus TaxID=3886 RepID=A0AAN9LCM1_PHACN